MNVNCPECRSVFRVDPGRIPGASVRARCAVCGGVITVSREGASAAPTPVAGTTMPSAPPRPPAAAEATSQHFGSALTPPIAQPATRATPVMPSAASVSPPAPPPRASSMPTPVGTPGISTYGGGRPSGAFPVGGLPPLPPASPPPRPAPQPPPSMTPPASPPRPASMPPVAMPPAPPRSAPPAMNVAPASSASPSRPAPAAPPPRPALGGSASGTRPINPFLANDPNAKARRLARALISDLISYFPEKKEEGLRKGTLRDLFSEEIKKSYQEFVDQIGREFAESTTHFTDALNDILANGQKVFEGNKSGVE
jgi:predicted Zn finger-like uncharacterized protein